MKNKNKQIIYIFLIFSMIISLSHLLVENFYSSISSKEIILNKAREIALKKENLFDTFLKKSENILISTRESKIFNKFITSNNHKDEIKDLFLTLANANNDFMQFRFIDENGQESIRVERKYKGEKAQIIQDTLLQNKSNRYYFEESKILKKNEVWFSSIELNMENDKIQIPFNPTIRAISSVFIDGKFKGTIIINYFVESLIDELVHEPMLKITLVDALGFVISSFEKSKNWGYYKKENYNIKDEYSGDFVNILTKDLYETKDLLSKSLDLNLYDNVFIVLEVNESFFKEQKSGEFKQEILSSLLYLVISLCLSFVMIRIFTKLFKDLGEQKDTVYRLELASNVASMAIWELDAKTRDVIWTKNIKSILKIEDDLSYDKFLSLVHPKEKEIFKKEFLNSIDEKREFSISHKMVLENGEIRFLEEKGKHFYDEKGNHLKSVGCTYDITEKYESEKLKIKIDKQNRQFERLFNKYDENVIASTTNLNGIITYTSKAFCEISGYSKKELIGSPQNIVRHPDSSSSTFEVLWNTIQEGGVWQGELKNKNKDGSYYWVYAFIYPEYNDDNEIHGYSAIRQDITPQKELEELHKNVKSSIEVASFIQESLLPTDIFVNSCFKDNFIIWEPKDIVGGDIYFLEKLRNEEECLLMVIDCTGHGVPGAFISMLIKAIEKQIVQALINKPTKEISPGKILQEFNITLKEILKQKKRNLASNIGFDGGIIYYNKKEKIIRYAGASNSLIYYDNNEIKTIRGDRHSIGYKNSDISYEFENHDINVEEGMKFYLFSDGYIDQIGGEKNQSFSKSRTIDIIDKNKDKEMQDQKNILIKELNNYQGELERIDDVTFIAVEI